MDLYAYKIRRIYYKISLTGHWWKLYRDRRDENWRESPYNQIRCLCGAFVGQKTDAFTWVLQHQSYTV